MPRTSVVLADDHAVLREGLRALIDAQPDLTVVGVAANGPDALLQVREKLPRVLCLDLSMPGPGSGVTIAAVSPLSPRPRTLVLTMHDDTAYVRSSLTAGATGYMLKSSPLPDLLVAIRAVAVGTRVVDAALQSALADTPVPGLPARFSRREAEVLQLLVKGHTHKEIADLLFLIHAPEESVASGVSSVLWHRHSCLCGLDGTDRNVCATKPRTGQPHQVRV